MITRNTKKQIIWIDEETQSYIVINSSLRDRVHTMHTSANGHRTTEVYGGPINRELLLRLGLRRVDHAGQ